MADANINIGVNFQSQSITQLEGKLASLNAQIKKVPVNSREFKVLSAEIRNLQGTIEGANNKLKAFNPDELVGNFGKIAGSIGAVSAVYTAFADDGSKSAEELAKQTQKVIAVLEIARLVEGAYAAIKAATTIATLANTGAVAAETVAYGQDTVATETNTTATVQNATAQVLTTGALRAKFEAIVADSLAQSANTKAAKESLIANGLLKKSTEATTAATTASTTATTTATTASKGLLNTLKGFASRALTNPYVLIAAAIAAIIGGIIKWRQSADEAMFTTAKFGFEIENLSEVLDNVNKQYESNLVFLIKSEQVLRNDIGTQEERKQILEASTQLLKEQGVSQEDINEAVKYGTGLVELYVAALEKQIAVTAALEELKLAYQELFKAQNDISENAPGFFETLANGFISLGDAAEFAKLQEQELAENTAEAVGEVEEKIAKLRGNLSNALRAQGEANKKFAKDTAKEASGILSNAGIDAKKQQEDLDAFLKKSRDLRNKAISDDFARQKAELKASFDDELKAYEKQYKELGLKTKESEKAFGEGKLAIRKKYKADLIKIEAEEKFERIKIAQETVRIQIDLQNAVFDLRQSAIEASRRELKDNQEVFRSREELYKQEERILLESIELGAERADALEKQRDADKELAKAEGRKLLATANSEEERTKIIEDTNLKLALIQKKYDAQNNTLQAERQRQNDQLVINRYENELAIVQEGELKLQNEVQKIRNPERRNRKELENAVDVAKKRLEIAKKYNKDILNAEAELSAAEQALLDNKLERRQRAYDESKQLIFDAFSAILNQIQTQADLQDLRFSEEIERVNKVYEDRFKLIDEEGKKLDDLEKAKEKNLSATERKRRALAKQRADLEAQQAEELARLEADRANAAADAAIKQAEVNFALAVGQIIVSTAEAITKSIAASPQTGGLPFSAFAAAQGAIQLAAANNARQLAIAQAEASRPGVVGAKNVRVSKAAGGLITGPGNGVSDSVPANLSAGEFVVNANATRQFLPTLRAINEAGLQGGNPVNPSPFSNDEVVVLLSRIEDKLAQPTRSYIVTSDIENIQNKQNYINRRSNVL